MSHIKRHLPQQVFMSMTIVSYYPFTALDFGEEILGYLPVLHLHTQVSKAFINLQIFIVGSLYLKNFLNVSGHKRNA